jgi:amidase
MEQKVQAAERPFVGIVDEVRVEGAEKGLLANTTFVVKDLFDIEGRITSAGNPDWQRTHPESTTTAPVILRLLRSGATLIGKTLTDELAFGLDGINAHYGTPLNSQFPDRIPGGSSSGSVSAVAARVTDFALGTDTVGSIRVPSSYCGIFGFRPTHALIDVTGVVPLGPSFDTVAWCSSSADLLLRVGEVLLPDRHQDGTNSVFILEDLFDLMRDRPMARMVQESVVTQLRSLGLEVKSLRFPSTFVEECCDCFNVIRSREAWKIHGAWIDEVVPHFGPGVKQRFEQCGQVTDDDSDRARTKRATLKEWFAEGVGGALLVSPTTCDWPPLLSTDAEGLLLNRQQNIRLSVLSSLFGFPQVSVPIEMHQGKRFGISLAFNAGQDLSLLRFAKQFAGKNACTS